MNGSLAIPRSANGRFDVALIAAASLLAIGASVFVTNANGLPVRGTGAAIGVVGIALLCAFVSRLEIALYAFMPLLTAVRAEPAPVDFMAVGLTGALVLRREFRMFVPPRIVVTALAIFILSYAPAVLSAQYFNRALFYTAATMLVVAGGYVAFQLAARDIRIAERAYVFAGLLLGIETIIALIPSPIAGLFRDSYPTGFRVYGLFKDSNVFGPFVTTAIALLCARLPELHWAPRIGAILLALAAVPASLARGAIVVVAAALLMLGVVATYRRWRATALYCFGILGAGALAGGAFLLASGSSLARDRLTTIFQDYDAVRFGGQLAGLNWVKEHPISFGMGPGNYEFVLNLPSHQTYLRMLVETGPLSLIAFLVLLWTAIRLVRVPDRGTVAWVASLIGLVMYGVLIDALHWRHLWVVGAIALATATRPQGRGSDPPRPEASTP